MKLPVFKGNELIKFLEQLEFVIVRKNGSHIRLHHQDGRVTTVPVHQGKDLPVGLLRKIIREDLKISLEEFLDLYSDK